MIFRCFRPFQQGCDNRLWVFHKEDNGVCPISVNMLSSYNYMRVILTTVGMHTKHAY